MTIVCDPVCQANRKIKWIFCKSTIRLKYCSTKHWSIYIPAGKSQGTVQSHNHLHPITAMGSLSICKEVNNYLFVMTFSLQTICCSVHFQANKNVLSIIPFPVVEVRGMTTLPLNREHATRNASVCSAAQKLWGCVIRDSRLTESNIMEWKVHHALVSTKPLEFQGIEFSNHVTVRQKTKMSLSTVGVLSS